jgi:hypothetical protein
MITNLSRGIYTKNNICFEENDFNIKGADASVASEG